MYKYQIKSTAQIYEPAKGTYNQHIKDGSPAATT